MLRFIERPAACMVEERHRFACAGIRLATAADVPVIRQLLREKRHLVRLRFLQSQDVGSL